LWQLRLVATAVRRAGPDSDGDGLILTVHVLRRAVWHAADCLDKGMRVIVIGPLVPADLQRRDPRMARNVLF